MENDLLIYSDLLFDNFDDLLDFSKEEEAQMMSSAAETETVTVAPPAWNKDGENLLPCAHTTPKDIAGASEDAFLCDDLDVAEMEWLSNFVEESFSPSGVDVSNATNNCITVGSNSNNNGIGFSSSNDNNGFYHHPMLTEYNQDNELLYLANSPLSVLENNGILINNNNSSGMSSSTYSSSLSSPTSSSCSAVVSDLKPTERGRAPRTKRTRPLSFSHITTDPVLPTSIDTHYSAEEPIPKKKKLKIKFSQPPIALLTTAITNNEGGDVRKCLHCGIQKTPQWRLGPMGPKTLCNACGVRYKSGRLFPEYRPAASPTFVASVHSNSHKKVVEMRMTKTSTEEQECAAVAAKQVSSKCCELLNYIRGSKDWGAHEGRKDRGVAV